MKLFAVLVFLLPLALWSENAQIERICSSTAIKRQEKHAKELSGKNLKLQTDRLRARYIEIKGVFDEITSQRGHFPLNYLKGCLKKKEAVFHALEKLLYPYSNDSLKFNHTLSEYYSWRKDFRMATHYLDRAIALDSSNTKLLWEGLELFLRSKGIDLNQSVENFRKQKKVVHPETIHEAERRLHAIVKHKESPNQLRVRAYQRLGLFAFLKNQVDQGILYFHKILEIDPRHKFSLVALKYEYKKQGNYEKLVPVLRQLIGMEPKQKIYYSDILPALKFQNLPYEVLSYTGLAEKNAIKNSTISGYRSWALAKLDRLKKAEDYANQALKSNPKQQEAREVLSMVWENKGDTYKTKEQMGHAFSAYKKAYGFSSASLHLREKLAHMLFDYRRNLNFSPKEAASQDLREAVNYLKPLLKEKVVRENTLIILARSAKFIEDQDTLQRACQKIKILQGDENESYQSHCLKI